MKNEKKILTGNIFVKKEKGKTTFQLEAIIDGDITRLQPTDDLFADEDEKGQKYSAKSKRYEIIKDFVEAEKIDLFPKQNSSNYFVRTNNGRSGIFYDVNEDCLTLSRDFPQKSRVCLITYFVNDTQK